MVVAYIDVTLSFLHILWLSIVMSAALAVVGLMLKRYMPSLLRKRHGRKVLVGIQVCMIAVCIGAVVLASTEKLGPHLSIRKTRASVPVVDYNVYFKQFRDKEDIKEQSIDAKSGLVLATYVENHNVLIRYKTAPQVVQKEWSKLKHKPVHYNVSGSSKATSGSLIFGFPIVGIAVFLTLRGLVFRSEHDAFWGASTIMSAKTAKNAAPVPEKLYQSREEQMKIVFGSDYIQLLVANQDRRLHIGTPERVAEFAATLRALNFADTTTKTDKTYMVQSFGPAQELFIQDTTTGEFIRFSQESYRQWAGDVTHWLSTHEVVIDTQRVSSTTKVPESTQVRNFHQQLSPTRRRT